MDVFTVTKDRRVFLNDVEIKRVHAFSIDVESMHNPKVVLRVGVDEINIEGYTDHWQSRKET